MVKKKQKEEADDEREDKMGKNAKKSRSLIK